MRWCYRDCTQSLPSGRNPSCSARHSSLPLTGSITQSEVPEGFATIVPIYVHFDKTTHAKLGSVLLVGSSTKPVTIEIALPKKPQRASVNAMHDVLSR